MGLLEPHFVNSMLLLLLSSSEDVDGDGDGGATPHPAASDTSPVVAVSAGPSDGAFAGAQATAGAGAGAGVAVGGAASDRNTPPVAAGRAATPTPPPSSAAVDAARSASARSGDSSACAAVALDVAALFPLEAPDVDVLSPSLAKHRVRDGSDVSGDSERRTPRSGVASPLELFGGSAVASMPSLELTAAVVASTEHDMVSGWAVPICVRPEAVVVDEVTRDGSVREHGVFVVDRDAACTMLQASRRHSPLLRCLLSLWPSRLRSGSVVCKAWRASCLHSLTDTGLPTVVVPDPSQDLWRARRVLRSLQCISRRERPLGVL
jgi:hypothetical protein